jgi:hypothetical protein
VRVLFDFQGFEFEKEKRRGGKSAAPLQFL